MVLVSVDVAENRESQKEKRGKRTKTCVRLVTKCVKDVQSFLGFGNFYRRFIQGFANITAPLTSLTRKDTTWHWDDDQQTAFETLKQRFTSAPILLMPDFSKPFRLETDASDYDYGTILSQQSDNGHWLPVAYMSKQMLPAEHNYVIYDKELLTIIEALKLWHHYLEGSPHPVEIWSDHKNLEYFRSAQSLNRRQARWSLFLSCFRFTISHRAGTLNKADHLTQRSDHQEGVEFDNSNTTVLHQSIFRINTTGWRSPAPKKTLRDAIKESARNDLLANSIYGTKTLGPRCLADGLQEWNLEDGLLLFKGKIYENLCS